MTISQIETSKGRIEYSLLGEGRSILLVHGEHVDCREIIFQKGLDPKTFCFITPSRPGYGHTPLTDQNKTPKGTAELFISLLDQLEIQKTIIIGISAGGLIAIEIAANYPDRVENLVLISALTKKWFIKTDKVYRGGKILFAPEIERFTWFLYRLCFRLVPIIMAKTMFKELSTYRPVEFSKDEFEELKEMTLNMRSGAGFDNDLDQNIEQEILSKIECPSLILHSNYDNAVDISHPENAKRRIKNSTIVTFNNRWGHLLWIGADYQAPLKEIRKQLN